MTDLIPFVALACAASLALVIEFAPRRPPRRPRKEPPLTRQDLAPVVYGTTRACSVCGAGASADLVKTLEAERDELRAAIFGSADYRRKLRNGNFREMAEVLHAAQKGGLARAEAAETRVAEAKALLIEARADWLEANDPRDGTDCVTPYDAWLWKAGRA